MPIPKLVALQIHDKKKKVGIVLTFLVGLFVTVCSGIRLMYLAKVNSLSNVTYHYNDIGAWTGLEAYLGIWCACMPAIMGPIARFFSSFVGSRFSSGSKSGSSRSNNHMYANHIHRDSKTRFGSKPVETSEQVELAKHAQKRGVTEKTYVRSLYALSEGRASRDEMELVYQPAHREFSV